MEDSGGVDGEEGEKETNSVKDEAHLEKEARMLRKRVAARNLLQGEVKNEIVIDIAMDIETIGDQEENG